MMRIVIILLAFLISGCVTPNKIPTSMMESSLQYRGFSIQRPADLNWYVLTNEQHPLNAMFRIDSGSDSHTVHALIQLRKIPKQPNTADEFKKIVDDNFLNGIDGLKYVLVSYESKKSVKQGQWSIEYDLVFWNHVSMNSNQPLLISMKGYVVIHPEWGKTVVVAYYSKRGLKTEMVDKFEKTEKTLIQSVILESSPGIPLTG